MRPGLTLLASDVQLMLSVGLSIVCLDELTLEYVYRESRDAILLSTQ